ncbi:MAG TPA: glucose 1-dehydrogenase [Candidatus Methylomirabilis sp.]|nr:glucose 1-dehydrogenase [Candidatus Methylomirabilis sp.]
MGSSLLGKVATVTGASRGIGAAIARRLAAEGAAVCVSHRSSAAAAAEVVAEIEYKGGRAAAIQADMGVVEEARRVVRSTIERFGALDILVNNAAIGERKKYTDVAEAEFDATFAVNVRGPFFAIQEAAPRMRDGGRIINISSCGTHITQPTAMLCVYQASKGALEQLAHCFAKELGPRGITINSVLPGLVETELAKQVPEEYRKSIRERTALGRIGKPEDIAGVVAFLASDAGRWITGQAISVTGGLE